MLNKAQRKEKAKSPLGRMRERLRGRYVDPCHLGCFYCERFVGYEGGCPGVKARPDNAGQLPLCHVNYRTGRREMPNDADGRLLPGQERFWKSVFSHGQRLARMGEQNRVDATHTARQAAIRRVRENQKKMKVG